MAGRKGLAFTGPGPGQISSEEVGGSTVASAGRG